MAKKKRIKFFKLFLLFPIFFILIFFLFLNFSFKDYKIENKDFYVNENLFFRFEIKRIFSNITIVNTTNQSYLIGFQIEPNLLTFGAFSKDSPIKSIRRFIEIKNENYSIIQYEIKCIGKICENLEIKNEKGKILKQNVTVEIKFLIERAEIGYYDGHIYVISKIPKNFISEFFLMLI